MLSRSIATDRLPASIRHAGGRDSDWGGGAGTLRRLGLANRLNLVPRDRMQLPVAEVPVEPLELDSIFVRRGLVGLFLAPPDYGVLPRVGCTLAEAVDAPEIGAHVIEPFPCLQKARV